MSEEFNNDEHTREYMRNYMRKYMKYKYKHVSFFLKKGEDEDIIRKLESVPVKADYIRDLIRKDISE